MDDQRWVIFGEAGEYSDYRVEVIAVYDTAAAARHACADLVEAVNAWRERCRAFYASLPRAGALGMDARVAFGAARHHKRMEWETANPEPAKIMDAYTVVAVPYNSVFARKAP